MWGVGDYLVRGPTQGGPLATVGKTQISVDDFKHAYQQEVQSLGRKLGRPLTPEQGKLLGVPPAAMPASDGSGRARSSRHGAWRHGLRRHRRRHHQRRESDDHRLQGQDRRQQIRAGHPSGRLSQRGRIRAGPPPRPVARAADGDAGRRRRTAEVPGGRAVPLPRRDARHRIHHPRLHEAHQPSPSRTRSSNGSSSTRTRASTSPWRSARPICCCCRATRHCRAQR